MDHWEYNAIDHRNYLTGEKYTEDMVDTMLNGFGKDGWELVGWFGIWVIFKRKLNS